VRIVDMRAQALAKPWEGSDGGRVVVAFLGRLVERKGAVELVEAVAALDPELLDNLVVRIGGRGPLLAPIEESVARHGLAAVVTCEGFIADDDKPGFLAAADIAVFPATGGESFGIVLTEAMAAGSGAVLGGDNPGYAWTLDNPDAVIDPRDTAAFATRLATLIDDTGAREAIHAQQAERVREFDVAVVADRVEALYGLAE
jgi:phosphatidylinositol alpha-mannosyltransferase